MTTLWDTTGTAVVKALAAERRTGGAVTSGIALTLVVVVDHEDVEEAEEAATIAASRHPMRMLMVIRRQIDAPVPRLDAEVTIGGRLGPGEAVVLRMYGRLGPARRVGDAAAARAGRAGRDVVARRAAGARSPTTRSACSPSGGSPTCSALADPNAALQQRASDFAPGDTDLAWTRLTPWRAALASAFDGARRAADVGGRARRGRTSRPRGCWPGWLAARLGHRRRRSTAPTTSRSAASRSRSPTARPRRDARGRQPGAAPRGPAGLVHAVRRAPARRAAGRGAAPPRPRPRLRRGAVRRSPGIEGLEDRSPHRTHIWYDPAEHEAAAA